MRDTINLNAGWRFIKGAALAPEQMMPEECTQVNLPHCFNAEDTAYMGVCTYRRELSVSDDFKECSLFLEFQGVNSVCTVYLNDRLLGEHKGGYSAFRFDITDSCIWGSKNVLTVMADNRRDGHEDVSPIFGDFSVLGGIYRDVSLICVSGTHFDLMYYGSPGVFLTPVFDDKGNAELNVSARIIQTTECEFEVLLKNPEGRECVRKTVGSDTGELSFPIPEPELWDGKTAPKLYTCVLTLKNEDTVHDSIELPVGLRKFDVDADKGFFLNDRHYPIRGVSKHQDYAGKSNATSSEDLDTDMSLIKELGANAVRLSHYQHPQYFYNLCDNEGMIVWAEIPMLKITDNEALIQNAKQQLSELILQNYHHPCICFWGLQNEIAIYGEEQYMFDAVEELQRLAKKLDSTRLTVSANLNSVRNKSPLNFISDIIGYNVYFGWYYGNMEDYAEFLDKFHKDNPSVPLGISEYGVDCNLSLHSETPKRKDYSEEFQALFHETVYPVIASREFVWGSFVWNMFDFSSSLRNEGKTVGFNAKGLVTNDRKIRKDAFYFYKACWSDEPFLHIVSRRFKNRCAQRIDIKVYSNMFEVTLEAGGSKETKRGRHVFMFENVPLQPGENRITACAGNIGDEVVFYRVDSPDESYVYTDPNPGFNVRNWFEPGESREDLFPDDCYSLNDSVNELMKNAEVWALICEDLPFFAGESKIPKGLSLSMLSMLNRISGQLDEQVIINLNRKLNKIKRAEQ